MDGHHTLFIIQNKLNTKTTYDFTYMNPYLFDQEFWKSRLLIHLGRLTCIFSCMAIGIYWAYAVKLSPLQASFSILFRYSELSFSGSNTVHIKES